MTNLAPFLSYVFIATFTPGPNNIMSMTNATRDGFKKTLKFNFGVFAGFLIIMLASSYFNLMLFSLIPKVKILMSIVGAAYMLYLAYKIFTSRPSEEEADNSRINSFPTGLIMQFVNVKVILYGITVFSSFIIPSYDSPIILILFSVLLAFIGFTSTVCWSLFGALFQKLLSKYWKAFNVVMSLLLVYCAIAIF